MNNTKTLTQVNHVGNLKWDAASETWIPITADDFSLGASGAAPSTGSVTQVGDSDTNVTLSASSTAWKGRAIYNDSSSVLRVKLGANASATSFTVLLSGNGSGVGGYYEVPYGYTGIIDGIWDSDAGGNAYITELTI